MPARLNKAALAAAAAGFLAGAAFIFTGNDALPAALGFSAALILAFLLQRDALPVKGWLLFGLGFYVTAFHWFPQITAKFTSWSLPAALLGSCLFWFAGALQFALAALVATTLRAPFWRASLLSLPIAWVTSELWVPRLVPWSLGQVLIGLPWVAHAAALGGTPLVTFFFLWWTAAIVRLCTTRRLPKPLLAVQLCSIVLVCGYGIYHRRSLAADHAAAPQISAALVQGNLDFLTDYNLEHWSANIERHRSLSLLAQSSTPPDLIIWPESAVGTDFSIGETLLPPASQRHPFPALARNLIFGGQTLVAAGARPQYFLSAFLLTNDGKLSGRYDKLTFIPFAEKIPFEDFFPALKKLHGRNYDLLQSAGSKETSRLLLSHRGERYVLGMAICYEELFSDAHMPHDAAEDPHLLISLSNDGWFFDTVAPGQRLFLARWKAVEFGRYLLRATNTGITSVIDYSGRVRLSLPPHRAAYLRVDDVPLLTKPTPYSANSGLLLRALSAPFLLLSGARLYAKMRSRRLAE